MTCRQAFSGTTHKACPHSVRTSGAGEPRHIGHCSSPSVTRFSSFSSPLSVDSAPSPLGDACFPNAPILPISAACMRACGLASGRSGGVGESPTTMADVDDVPGGRARGTPGGMGSEESDASDRLEDGDVAREREPEWPRGAFLPVSAVRSTTREVEAAGPGHDETLSARLVKVPPSAV